MSLAGWLAAAAVGTAAGALSGLIGIGGGAIMVPFLYFAFAHPETFGVHIPVAQQAVSAHATSLAAIVPISLRGVWIYHRAGLVDWVTVRRMGIPSAASAVLGAGLAIAVPTELLKALFGFFLLAAALRLLWGGGEEDAGSRISKRGRYTGRAILGGLVVGLLSSVLGVGGGIVAIPVLIHLLHLPLRRVSPTSLAVIACTATAAVSGYLVAGARVEPGPAGALTFVEVGSAIALTVGAFLSIRLGTILHRRLPVRSLRWLFAAVFLLIGIRLALQNLIHVLGG